LIGLELDDRDVVRRLHDSLDHVSMWRKSDRFVKQLLPVDRQPELEVPTAVRRAVQVDRRR
jgi:hypothetical protein